jgi:hypothetical protein
MVDREVGHHHFQSVVVGTPATKRSAEFRL